MKIENDFSIKNEIIELNDKNFFYAISKSQYPVLVKFWAEWCNPCKKLTSILESMRPYFMNKINLYSVNIEHNPNLTSKYNINSIPTLCIFINGKIKECKVGLISVSEIKVFIKKNI